MPDVCVSLAYASHEHAQVQNNNTELAVHLTAIGSSMQELTASSKKPQRLMLHADLQQMAW